MSLLLVRVTLWAGGLARLGRHRRHRLAAANYPQRVGRARCRRRRCPELAVAAGLDLAEPAVLPGRAVGAFGHSPTSTCSAGVMPSSSLRPRCWCRRSASVCCYWRLRSPAACSAASISLRFKASSTPVPAGAMVRIAVSAMRRDPSPNFAVPARPHARRLFGALCAGGAGWHCILSSERALPMFVRNLLLVIGALCLLGGIALSVVWYSQIGQRRGPGAATAESGRAGGQPRDCDRHLTAPGRPRLERGRRRARSGPAACCAAKSRRTNSSAR